ncbi:hypothetical protein [Sphingomonas sp. Ant H11]|uniref:hypothetical protein n=1 Tax=Sphingomonas sp. Ant H11 TaxID=1564113 RepID=UPI001E495598|nr:hypothetical protein [Sphingomonas sp. Ant H11]
MTKAVALAPIRNAISPSAIARRQPRPSDVATRGGGTKGGTVRAATGSTCGESKRAGAVSGTGGGVSSIAALSGP